jgi:hypothetical protein
VATTAFLGFEAGDFSEVESSSGSVSIVTSPVRTGVYAARCNPATTFTGRVARLGARGATGTLGANTASPFYTRFYFRYATKPSSNDEEIVQAISAGSFKSSIRINSSGNLVQYDRLNALVATGSTVLDADTWYRIEWKVGSGSGSSAPYEIKINGTSELSGTADLGTGVADRFDFGKITNRNGNGVDFFYDDIRNDDADFPGAGEVQVMQPNANGNYQTWTIGAGSGSHWEIVDEIPQNTTDYLLSTGTSGDAETEALESAASAGVSGTINSVQSLGAFRRDAVNAAVRVRLRSGTTDSDTTSNYTPTTSYVTIGKIFDTDPADAGAWTTGDLDGVEVGGVEQTTAKTRMTQCLVMVDYTPEAPSTKNYYGGGFANSKRLTRGIGW